jgi:hypothetical protein
LKNTPKATINLTLKGHITHVSCNNISLMNMYVWWSHKILTELRNSYYLVTLQPSWCHRVTHYSHVHSEMGGNNPFVLPSLGWWEREPGDRGDGFHPKHPYLPASSDTVTNSAFQGDMLFSNFWENLRTSVFQTFSKEVSLSWGSYMTFQLEFA